MKAARVSKYLLTAAIAAGLSLSAFAAGSRSTPEDAWRLLEQAVDVVQAQGIAKAATTFNDRKGAFVKDDLYVFAVDLKSGRFQAMGMNPKLTGTDAVGLKDVEGNAMVQQMIDKTKSGGEVVVEYVWRNPVTNAVERKRSYARREGDTLIGVGYYRE